MDIKKYPLTKEQRANPDLVKILADMKNLRNTIAELYKKKPDIDRKLVHQYISKNYPGLTKSYPAVIGTMIDTLSYSEHAFVELLDDMKKSMIERQKTDEKRKKDGVPEDKKRREKEAMEQFIHLQAMYEKRRYIYTTPRYSGKIAAKIYNEASARMHRGIRDLEEAKEDAESEFDRKNIEYDRERREDFKKFVIENARENGIVPDKYEEDLLLEKIMEIEKKYKESQPEKKDSQPEKKEIIADK